MTPTSSSAARPAGAGPVGQDGEAVGQEAADDAAHRLLVAPEVGGDLRDGEAQVGQADHLQALALVGGKLPAAGAGVQVIELPRGQGDADDLRHGRPSCLPFYETVTRSCLATSN